jgi:hypothetical protein
VVGINERRTDFEVSETFLKAHPATPQYQEVIDSYATTVAGRAVCGSPEHRPGQTGLESDDAVTVRHHGAQPYSVWGAGLTSIAE